MAWRLGWVAVVTLVVGGSACSGEGGTDPTPPAKPVASVVVSPTSLALAPGETGGLTADLRAADGTGLSGRPVTWASSDPVVATVSSQGVVSALTVGSTTITATAEGKAGSAQVVVAHPPAAAVVVLPATLSVQTGQTGQFTAEARNPAGATIPGKTFAWVSSNPLVATVSQTGRVSSLMPGTSTITASVDYKIGSATLTVVPGPVATVEVAPAASTVEVTRTIQLVATAKDAGGFVVPDQPVAWVSSAPSIASVSNTGLVTGVVPGGPVTVTAALAGKTGTASITVVPGPVASVTVTPGASTLQVGQTVQLAAAAKDAQGNAIAGRPVTWTSAVPATASVSTTGLVAAVAAGGPVTISATVDEVTGTAAVTVVPSPPATATVSITPSSSYIVIGQTVQLTATPRDSQGQPVTGRPVVWSSLNPGVATVSTGGLVSGIAAGGPVAIRATIDGVIGVASVTVALPFPVANSFVIEFRPSVASAVSPTDVQLIVDVPVGTTSAELRRPGGSVIPLVQVSGTRRHSVLLTASQVLESYLADPSAQALRVSYLGDLVLSGTTPSSHQLHIMVRDGAIPDATYWVLDPTLQRTEHVVNVRADQVQADGATPAVVSRFYQAFPDNYDFLALSWQAFHPGALVNYQGLRNTTLGTGLPAFDNTAASGAAGTQRLQGLIHFRSNFDHAHAVLSHEIAHCCMNGLRNTPLSTSTFHWPLSSAAIGVIGMGGPSLWLRLTARQDGSYLVERQTPYGNFNPLELYLLGLVGHSDVPDQVVFPPQNVELLPGAVLNGPVTVVPIGDIISANGARVPGYPSARRDFRVATVVVTRERLLSAAELAYFEFMAARGELRVPTDDAYGRPFYVLTGGRGTLTTSIP